MLLLGRRQAGDETHTQSPSYSHSHTRSNTHTHTRVDKETSPGPLAISIVCMYVCVCVGVAGLRQTTTRIKSQTNEQIYSQNDSMFKCMSVSVYVMSLLPSVSAAAQDIYVICIYIYTYIGTSYIYCKIP